MVLKALALAKHRLAQFDMVSPIKTIRSNLSHPLFQTSRCSKPSVLTSLIRCFNKVVPINNLFDGLKYLSYVMRLPLPTHMESVRTIRSICLAHVSSFTRDFEAAFSRRDDFDCTDRRWACYAARNAVLRKQHPVYSQKTQNTTHTVVSSSKTIRSNLSPPLFQTRLNSIRCNLDHPLFHTRQSIQMW